MSNKQNIDNGDIESKKLIPNITQNSSHFIPNQEENTLSNYINIVYRKTNKLYFLSMH
ncbi:hypothetical protein MASR1M68_07700 [Elusimicrobiota bacterium]